MTEPEQRASPEAEFQSILEERHPERVLHAILDPRLGSQFLKEAPSATFVEVLRVLDPRYFLDPIKEVYRWLDWRRARQRKLGFSDKYLDDFLAVVQKIFARRRDAGHNLGLHEYNYLLDCARVLGYGDMACTTWKEMTEIHGIEPNLQSYNYFMEAQCWAGAYHTLTRWDFQVDDFRYKQRTKDERSIKWRSYRTGDEGISQRMLRMFQLMVKKGVDGDESTFTNLMVALARNRDMRGVEGVLKSVWNIDVKLMFELDEEELETPTFYEPGSPLEPSSRLLFTIAHVYGINNDVPTGLSLVDFVSRQYNLTVPVPVWAELLEWTYVHQVYRSPKQRLKMGAGAGALPSSSAQSLWSLMLDEPYNITPTLPMCSLYARSMIEWQMVNLTVDAMRRARFLLEDSRTYRDLCRVEATQLDEEAKREYQAIKSKSGSQPFFYIPPASFLTARRDLLVATLAYHRNVLLLRNLVTDLLHGRHWDRSAKERSTRHWIRRVLPQMIEEWAEWVPNKVDMVDPSTGKITIELEGLRKRFSTQRWQDRLELADGRWMDYEKEFSVHLDRLVVPLDEMLAPYEPANFGPEGGSEGDAGDQSKGRELGDGAAERPMGFEEALGGKALE